MNVKEAVAAAKNYVGDLFQSEGLQNLGLEEVEYDEKQEFWIVTLGFSRPWDHALTGPFTAGLPPKRTYKIVTLDNDGHVHSVKNRDTVHAD